MSSSSCSTSDRRRFSRLHRFEKRTRFPNDYWHNGRNAQAAETVTSQLRERERIRELAIKNQYMRALVESDSRGIVTVDQTGRIVEANSTARKLLKLSPGCEGKSFEESVGESYNITGYLKEGKGFRAREILARRSGTTHFASLDPIRMNSGELVGGLFTVMEKKEMMRMAVEMTGAHAHFTFESILGAL